MVGRETERSPRVAETVHLSRSSRSWAAKRTTRGALATRVRVVQRTTLTRVAALHASVRFAAEPREERER